MDNCTISKVLKIQGYRKIMPRFQMAVAWGLVKVTKRFKRQIEQKRTKFCLPCNMGRSVDHEHLRGRSLLGLARQSRVRSLWHNKRHSVFLWQAEFNSIVIVQSFDLCIEVKVHQMIKQFDVALTSFVTGSVLKGHLPVRPKTSD